MKALRKKVVRADLISRLLVDNSRDIGVTSPTFTMPLYVEGRPRERLFLKLRLSLLSLTQIH